ncbi:MAG: ORF6N domain-containing protein [Fuscovulum sp.]|nr:ORF6N domain-containing protein [Fuscovulum sp.]
MTLPTIAGVQSRIHSLPNRPFFMLARDLADFYHVQVKRIMEQVRRNPGRFPEGFIFELSPEEYREKPPHFAETSQGKRHDLKQYGFTEKGALQLSSVLTGPVADAVSVTIIEAFLQLRDGTLDRLRVAAFKDEVAYIGRNRMRLAIKLAATEGWSFGKLWDEHDWSAARLGREVEEMRIRGYIPQTALFVPHYVWQRRRSERALMDAHAEDAARQPDLFGEKVH